MTVLTDTPIRLACDCTGPHCLEFAGKLHTQLGTRYRRNASILDLDDFTPGRTSRKRASHAKNLGYRFREIDRHRYEADIFNINTSLPERQGRPMADAYTKPMHFGENERLCELHHVYTYGVLRDEVLVAYLWLYRCGELAMVSSILGHGDHLKNDVMYLLVNGTIGEQQNLGGTMFYNLHTSGTDGLRYFKERLGFRSENVEWLL